MTRMRFLAALTAFALLGAAVAAPAFAGRGKGPKVRTSSHGAKGHGHGRLGKTKLDFKLDSHSWATGAEVTGIASLKGRSGHEWAPLADRSLTIMVDGEVTGTAVTDVTGVAVITWGPATDGGHTIKVGFGGDDIHKFAKRGQGFHVGPTDGTDDVQTIEEELADAQ